MKTLTPRLAPHVGIVIFLLLVLAVPRLAESSPNGHQNAIPVATKQKLAKVQIPFIANQGQIDKEVKFYARTFAGTVSVTETGELVYSFPKLENKKQVAGVTLKEELVGGNVTEVKGESQAVTKLNYFKGNDRSKWQSNIPSYDIVSLGEVYEGIEVKLKAYGNNVEKLFHVKPSAEPENITIRLSGGESARVNESGELEVETEQGTVRFSKPVAFQENGGKKEFVEVDYALQGREYGFNLGDYDRTRDLVIDPILAATFLGGRSSEELFALALDITGNVYVAGSTGSPDFPGVGAGSADNGFARNSEGFVAKLNADLSSILAATFLGGTGNDALTPGEIVSAIALDKMGNVYAAGRTSSSDFPGVDAGSADSTFAGQEEAFVAKLNSDLRSILAATFLGASRSDAAGALALDSTGNVYVAGSTSSADFPGVGPDSADSIFESPNLFGTGGEGFVARLNSDLSSILAATFLGGPFFEEADALALDSMGNVYVGGTTTGSSDFPGVGPGSADSTIFGTAEGFVAKLNSNLGSILAATFLGGSGRDDVRALALDSTGNVYVGGSTSSPDFPGVGPGSADSTVAADFGGFVAKLNSDLSAILAATFTGGGDSGCTANDIALNNTSVYIDGTSEDGVCVAKLNSDLSAIVAAAVLGQAGIDSTALALDSGGNVYVAGVAGPDFPDIDIGPGSADSTRDGRNEGFILKLDGNLSNLQQIVNKRVNFVVQGTSFNPTSVLGGPAGTFTVTAVLTNKTAENILEPINAIVKTLTNGNKLLSATEGNGGVGSKQAIDAGADDTLIPKESRTVQFKIGLANRNRFSFFVDVSGIVSGDD